MFWGMNAASSNILSQKQSTFTDAHPKSTLSLRDILRNPNSLSYFMEFMDRRHRSLLVQFWLTVESFKNPLESVDSDSSENENEPIQAASITSTVKEDISMIYDLYFSTSNPALSFIPNKYADVIRDFAQNETNPSEASQRRVRRCVLLAQRQVERAMEQDFESFERSELWFRALGDAGFTDTVPVNEPQSPPVPVRGKRSMSSVLLPSNAPTPRGNVGFTSHSLQQPDSIIDMLRSTSSASKSSLGSASVDSFPRSTPSNIEVLMSPVSDSAFETGRAPLFNDPEDEEQRAEEKRMEAIHAALTDIVAFEESHPVGNQRKPSNTSSLSLDQRKRKPVFDDEPEHDQGEDFGEEDDKELAQEAFQLAGPGDLQLSHDIARLGEKILKLQRQDGMLAGLVKKAELTGDTQELRLLKKSKAAIQREMKQLQFQKTQYEQQETANRLISDRTRVSIVSSTTADEAGKSVVRYLIEVQQLAQDGSFASGWVVARRYNEFLNMHTKLRERFALVRNLDFPGKRLVTTLSGSFLDSRKTALEKYLQVSTEYISVKSIYRRIIEHRHYPPGL